MSSNQNTSQDFSSLYQVIKSGNGEIEIKNGQIAVVHYIGTLEEDGSEFDSSRKRGEPFKFPLGEKVVIAGWDMGVLGMKVGEVRKLTIPAKYGYGEFGVPQAGIPGGATLVFEVELLGIE